MTTTTDAPAVAGPTTAELVARARELKPDTAHLHAFRAAADIDDAAARDVYPDFLTRARIRSDVGLVAETITRAIDVLLSAHGSGSFAEVNPLQRFWRDSATAARHGAVLPAIGYEVYGKALLGVEETITPLV
jgi:alkylation response protein AidB-like acyl-CoA dehydrogenase